MFLHFAAVNREQEFNDLSKLLTGIHQLWDLPAENRRSSLATYEDSVKAIIDTLTEGDIRDTRVFLSPSQLASCIGWRRPVKLTPLI